MGRVALALIAMLLPMVFGATVAGAAAPVVVAHIDGIINAGTARYLSRAIDEASRENASLLLVTLNTPGGLLGSTRQIVQKINESTVPVAVYVWPGGASATSAGTIIAMSAHFAGMAPGTNIGAAHPVGGQGEDIKGAMKEKAENDTVAFLKAQANLRGRNAEWAEQAIRKSASLPAGEALKFKVVDFLARDQAEALSKIEGRVPHGGLATGGEARPLALAGAELRELSMTTGERLLAFLGDPNVSYLLLLVGGLGIYAELSAPGGSVPGIVGVICLILALISFSTLPVNYGGVALLLVGLVLFVLEAFVTSYGLLTAGGLVSIVLGALFLMDPSTGDLRLSLALVLPTVIGVGGVAAVIAYFALKSRKSVYGGLGQFTEYEGVVQMIDSSGRSGKCLIRGEIWDFELSEPSKPVHLGAQVKVVERRGLKLIVAPR